MEPGANDEKTEKRANDNLYQASHPRISSSNEEWLEINDLAIFASDDRRMTPRVVFEMTISKSYKDSKISSKLWFEGIPEVREFILIKNYEIPPYHSPSIDDMDFPALEEIDEPDFKSESEFGPVEYKELHSTGKISSAVYKICTLNPLTRLATKIPTV